MNLLYASACAKHFLYIILLILITHCEIDVVNFILC